MTKGHRLFYPNKRGAGEVKDRKPKIDQKIERAGDNGL
jgi:hypothetical protein